jgi:hypothetical protein
MSPFAANVALNVNRGGTLRSEWVMLAGECYDNYDCPGVFLTPHGTVAVQGDHMSISAPTGEAVVEIPFALLMEAARAAG